MATFPATHGYPAFWKVNSPLPRLGRKHPPQRTRTKNTEKGNFMGRLRRALSNISQQDSNSSLAVTSHAPLPRGEALAAENPVPQRDGKNHQSWMGTGQMPGSHYSHTWQALALATPSSHHPEERTFPNLTSLSHIPRHLPLSLCQGQRL